MKKKLLFPLLCLACSVMAQQHINGSVVDTTEGKPVAGAKIYVSGTGMVAVTDKWGLFSVSGDQYPLKLIISAKGYTEKTMTIEGASQHGPIKVFIAPQMTDIEEVKLSTGYQKIAKERATGAFSVVESKQLQKQVTTNIIDRLPALASGVSLANGIGEENQLMIRGLSTLRGPKKPLIVVNNFPYEGDISRINPNMVETITILKDAAASSIWGARAANGVIVITTKEARFNQKFSVETTANTTIGAKPDLYYAKQMSSSDFIDIEILRFNNGNYNTDINSVSQPVLTPVVDLLNKQKKGLISADEAAREINRLRGIDVRDQYLKYMYQPLVNRQYAVNASGGTSQLSWTSFVGFDDNSGSLDEKYERINTRFQNNWKPFENLTLSTGVFFTNTNTKSGRSAYNSIAMKGVWKVPYTEFADVNGNALIVNSIYNQDYKNSLHGLGLLDWNYYPLTDWQHTVSKNNTNEIIINAGINYRFVKGLEADIKYQFQQLNSQGSNLSDADSYSTRNYVNSFAQRLGSGVKFIIPKGGILDKSNYQTGINNLRGQLNFSNTYGKQQIAAMVGGEFRNTVANYQSAKYYGYNSSDLSVGVVDFTNSYPNFVTGSASFIANSNSLRKTTLNYLSFYANVSYTYDQKYILYGSARRDASNLFGLNTNDQWNPFWSLGLGWNLANEKFYKSNLLPYLKFRASYGFNGNIDPAMVAVTTMIYDPGISVYTGGPTARIDQYFNPDLRWEMIGVTNIGLDFAAKNNRVSGSLDIFKKKGQNLFGQAPVDYTTGITTMLWNVAGIEGRGFDIAVTTKNIDKAFKWYSTINISQYKDQVKDYYLPTSFASDFVSQSGNTPPVSGITGLPVYSIFAYKWAGLDPATGEARGYLNGEVSKNYAEIMASDRGIEDLKYFGSAIPTNFGSFINSFIYRQLTLDLGVTYKLGYWFRRSSVNYSNLFLNRDGHSDFAMRWQKPGDEVITNVPVMQLTANNARDAFYNGSEVLVEKGDHVRLQYINLGYQINSELLRDLKIKNFQINAVVNNVGLIWAANKAGLDPDYSYGTYALKPITTYSLGFKFQF